MAFTPNVSFEFFKGLTGHAWTEAKDWVAGGRLAGIFSKLTTSIVQYPLVKEAFKESPKEFQQIYAIIKKAQSDPDSLTVEEIQLTDGILQRLLANESELLFEFVPHLSVEEHVLFIKAGEWFAQMAEDLSFFDAPEFDEELEGALEPDAFVDDDTDAPAAIVPAPKKPAGNVLRLELPSNRKLLQAFDALTEKLLIRTQGAVARLKGHYAQKQGHATQYLDRGATLVGQLKQINGRAHPLLVTYRRQLLSLQSAIVANNSGAIQRIGRELQTTFFLIQSQAPSVFPQQSPSRPELETLTRFNILTLPDICSDAPPAPTDMLTAIQPTLDIVQGHYQRHEGLLARTIANVEEKVTESVAARADAVVSRVLPKPAADYVMGRSSAAAPVPTPAIAVPAPFLPVASPAPVTTLPAAGEGTLSQFLSYGGSLLKTALERGTGVMSAGAFSSVASVLVFGIDQALSKMETTPAFADTRATLVRILGGLKSAKESGTWQEIYNSIMDASRALSSLKIYINGFRIPSFGAGKTSADSAEGIYSDNITALQTAMGSGPKAPEAQDWEMLAREEKDKLVENTTQFLTMKHIYEDVCGLKPINERFYIGLLMKAKKEENVEEALKALFFEELAKSNVPLVTQIWARLQYFFYGSVVKYYIRKASTVYFDEIFKYITRHKTENFDSLRNLFTTNFTRYLTILGGAYETVASKPQPIGTLQEMLRVELDKKEANLGFETQELYVEFAKIVLEKTVGTGILGWIAKKFLTNPEEIVKAVIDKSLGSIQDTRGYTHALNSVVREQLEEIWKLLQADHAQRQSSAGAPTPELSDVKKNELAGLVKNLFEILRKSKCQTKDELRDLIRGNLMSAKVTQAVDDLFIEDVIEKVTNILALCIQTLVQEDQLQKLTYKFASLVNRTFDLGETVTLEQMQEEERKIAKLSGQILRLSVNTAVEEKFDFSGKKQQTETNRFLADLHQRSTEFFTAAGQDIDELARMDVSSPDGFSKVNKLIAETLAYAAESYEACFQSRGTTLNSDNKDQISERHLGIAKASKPFVDTVKKLKEESQKLENIQKDTPYLKNILQLTPSIRIKLSERAVPNPDDLAFCANQVVKLETNIGELAKTGHLVALIGQLKGQVESISTLLAEMSNHSKTALFCQAQAQGNSLLMQIADEKKQQLASGTSRNELKGKIVQLRQQVMISIVDEALKPQFLAQLKAIEDAKIPLEIETAKGEFLKLNGIAQENANRGIQALKAKYRLIEEQMKSAIEGTHLLDANPIDTVKEAIRTTTEEARKHLQELAEWEKANVKDIPYINITPVDMKGVQDWASTLVFDRVKERLDGFMGFLKREETYRYGILNHLLLIPYVQRMRTVTQKV